MKLPNELKAIIESEIEGIKYNQLINDAQNISDRYRNNDGKGSRLLTKDNEAVAYSVVRMPATYASVYSALDYSLDVADFSIKSLLDVGAGTGAATWAADSLIELESVKCLERESAMRKVGEKIMSSSEGILSEAKWEAYDLIKDDINEKYDLVITSYVLNELSDVDRLKAVDKLWTATDKMLLIIEPGTPVGFNNLKKIREYLLKEGAYMVAPCPHEDKCIMPEEEWCHFACRVERSKMHRQLKGELSYEDEKFAYLAVSRELVDKVNARILRRPKIGKGNIIVQTCSSEGIENKNILKRDKELFKTIKKAQWGDKF